MAFHAVFSKRYNGWSELESAIEAITIAKEKGTAFEEFVYAYFTYFRELYQIGQLYMEGDIPLEFRQKIRLEKRDSGVDGLIVRMDGSVVAYQAKFRSRQAAPSYDELTSFWAESEHADARCIFANCYQLPQQAYKKKDQFTILRDTLTRLSSDFFEWLHQFAVSGNQERHILKFSPKPHQQKMIADVLKGFSADNRGKMLAACGTGKTLTALWIQEALQAEWILFVAPNLALIKQTLEAWTPQAQTPFSYLCICSDRTVSSDVAENEMNGETDWNGDPAEIESIGVPVTTEAEEIAGFFRQNLLKETPLPSEQNLESERRQEKKKKILFSTYQSLDAVVVALQIFFRESENRGFAFDIAFFDEAHRTAGSKNTPMFTMGMSDDLIPVKKRLFMTATERMVSPRIVGKASEYQYEVFSMDNEEQYGSTFTALSFRDAIEQGIISDYKIVLCCMKEQELKSIIHSNLILNVGNREISALNLFHQVLLARAMCEAGIHKVISYHRSILSAQQFILSPEGAALQDIVANFSGDGKTAPADVYCSCVTGAMSAGRRKEIFDEFIAAPYGVLSNARCLTEGVDAPAIDGVYFPDPKNSVIDIIQAVGRSLRKSSRWPDKISYVIIPIVMPDEVSSFGEINPEEFATLHTVIQALRDQDQVLADYIDHLNLQLATGQKPKPAAGEEVPILIQMTEQMELEDIAEKLFLRIAEVNRDTAKISREFIFQPDARASGVRRGSFTTVGDYSLPAYWRSCVRATLDKFSSLDVALPRTEITVGNNNVSHAVKIGALLQRRDKLFAVTPVGRQMAELLDFEQAIPLFREQLLKYYKLPPLSKEPVFPYRFVLKILAQTERISKFEFAYACYIAKDLSGRGVTEACDRIAYLRKTFPRIEVLSVSNKELVMTALNQKYDTTFHYQDIWTSATTSNNQFTYLKQHLSILWPDLLSKNAQEMVLADQKTGKALIETLLLQTNMIEVCPVEQLPILFTAFQGWLDV